MSSAYRDLSEPEWTPKLATVLERAATAIARLDARISVSPVATPWQQRAVWTGYTTALQAQGAEIDEIDIFGRECAVTLPGRPRMPSHLDDHHALHNWQTRLASRKARHWRDELPISTEVAADWVERPALLRALEIVARHARADSTITPWLTVPWLLKSMKITHATLPCLTIGDKALRLAPRDAQTIIVRNLRAFAERAEEGLVRLQALASGGEPTRCDTTAAGSASDGERIIISEEAACAPASNIAGTAGRIIWRTPLRFQARLGR